MPGQSDPFAVVHVLPDWQNTITPSHPSCQDPHLWCSSIHACSSLVLTGSEGTYHRWDPCKMSKGSCSPFLFAVQWQETQSLPEASGHIHSQLLGDPIARSSPFFFEKGFVSVIAPREVSELQIPQQPLLTCLGSPQPSVPGPVAHLAIHVHGQSMLRQKVSTRETVT